MVEQELPRVNIANVSDANATRAPSWSAGGDWTRAAPSSLLLQGYVPHGSPGDSSTFSRTLNLRPEGNATRSRCARRSSESTNRVVTRVGSYKAQRVRRKKVVPIQGPASMIATLWCAARRTYEVNTGSVS